MSECSSCGWRERPRTAVVQTRPIGGEPADDDETPDVARRRKKRRPVAPAPVSSRPPGAHPFATGTSLLVGLWVVLAGLSRLWPDAAMWLLGLGVLTVLGATGGVLWAAHKDGISLQPLWAARPILLVIVLVVQFLLVPFISLIHLVVNFSNAWRPFVVLLIGAAMIGSAIALEPSLVVAR